MSLHLHSNSWLLSPSAEQGISDITPCKEMHDKGTITSCGICEHKFSLVLKKHNCKACGFVFCGNCCKILNLVKKEDHGHRYRSRLCDHCAELYTSGEGSQFSIHEHTMIQTHEKQWRTKYREGSEPFEVTGEKDNAENISPFSSVGSTVLTPMVDGSKEQFAKGSYLTDKSSPRSEFRDLTNVTNNRPLIPQIAKVPVTSPGSLVSAGRVTSRGLPTPPTSISFSKSSKPTLKSPSGLRLYMKLNPDASPTALGLCVTTTKPIKSSSQSDVTSPTEGLKEESAVQLDREGGDEFNLLHALEAEAETGAAVDIIGETKASDKGHRVLDPTIISPVSLDSIVEVKKVATDIDKDIDIDKARASIRKALINRRLFKFMTGLSKLAQAARQCTELGIEISSSKQKQERHSSAIPEIKDATRVPGSAGVVMMPLTSAANQYDSRSKVSKEQAQSKYSFIVSNFVSQYLVVLVVCSLMQYLESVQEAHESHPEVIITHSQKLHGKDMVSPLHVRLLSVEMVLGANQISEVNTPIEASVATDSGTVILAIAIAIVILAAYASWTTKKFKNSH